MSADEGLFNVKNAEEAMIWLWRAHNIVNKRLAGDYSEDPEHPKVQFPTQTQCPECFSGAEYDESKVGAFLQRFYDAAVIKKDGLQQSARAKCREWWCR